MQLLMSTCFKVAVIYRLKRIKFSHPERQWPRVNRSGRLSHALFPVVVPIPQLAPGAFPPHPESQQSAKHSSATHRDDASPARVRYSHLREITIFNRGRVDSHTGKVAGFT